MNIPLNIDWQQILLHLFNFVILFAILYFLLYKPVKQFMDKRMEYYKKLDEDAKLNLENAEKAKEEYVKKLESAEDEIAAEKEKARKELEEAGTLKKKQAEEEAAKIIKDAHQRLEREHAQMLRDAQSEISDMVTSAAEKLVVKASTSEAYDQFLDTVKRSEVDE